GVQGPMTLFDFDPVAGTFTNVTPPSTVLDTSGSPSVETRMLALPTGQVLFSVDENQLAVYTPDGSPPASAQPTITSVKNNGDGTFTLTGTGLNGISEGGSWGDDAQMASNYPIVELTSGSTVYTARTFGWSSLVATGSTPVSTDFRLPPGV